MGKFSPLMKQYYSIKASCEDALLLFRMGDFYETFGEDAVTASRALNITLTSRQKDDQGNKIPLAGIPYHALDAYLVKLVKAGHKVAICEQVEDPKQAKGLVKREITRIITPGTIIEPSMLEEGENNYLAAVVEDGGSFGLALVDVSTGEFLTTEVHGEDKLSTELAKFRPSECLVPSSAGGWASVLGDGVLVQVLGDHCFSPEEAGSVLFDHFGGDVGGCHSRGLWPRAAGAAISYLHRAHLDALGHIHAIKEYSTADNMVLDEVTLRNLEVFRSIRDRSKKGSLLDLLDRTKTATGTRTLQRWLAMPSLSIEEINSRLDAIEEISANPLMREELLAGLDGCGDLERLIGRVSCGNASPKDLAALRRTLTRLPGICHLLEDATSGYLEDLRVRLDLGPLREVVTLIGRAISDEPPATLKDGGIIRDGYHQELDQIRSALRDGRSWISGLERDERDKTGIRSLKVGYNNVFGYYIEVTRPNLALVPSGYVRKQTLANAERFITPGLKEMESRVLSAQERSTALELEIFGTIRREVGSFASEVQARAAALGEIDVLLALANVALDGSYVRPQVNRGGAIVLRDSRHPVLDRSMRGGFVPNDVHLDGEKNRFMILTGPNMAGKSTFMRQVALAVILAQIGSYVPASFASIGVVDRIFTRVGAYDDLVSGQSTFMVEMTELANILNHATGDSLVLLDEIGRGTSTFDGLSIAWAMTEHLNNSVRSKTIFATHYHQLTQLADRQKGVVNWNMAVKEEGESIVFLRTVVPGATDKSYGIHVAKLAGVPGSVVRRAREILGEIETEIELEGGHRPRRRGSHNSRYTQLIFFDGPEGGVTAVPGPTDEEPRGEASEDPLHEEIEGLDLDSMTPLEALAKLSEIQGRLRGGGVGGVGDDVDDYGEDCEEDYDEDYEEGGCQGSHGGGGGG